VPLICIKLPGPVEHIEQWLPKRFRYRLVKTLHVRKKFFVYLLAPAEE